MKILVLADKESESLWDYFDKSKIKDIDLIISCGDLDSRYLSFLASFTHAPVLYVHGNHDSSYSKRPPEGCTCIEDKIYTFNGVRILGLGGSMRYKNGPHQYSQYDMNRRIFKMTPQLICKRGFDILITHSPAYGLNDGDDLPHKGFTGFVKLLDKYKPSYFIHGHVHMSYGRKHIREYTYKDTKIINAYEKYIVEI